MARVLAEELLPTGREVRALTLGDDAVPRDLGFPVVLSHGSRIRFSAKALWATRACQHYIYDGPHLAQIHRLPGLRQKPTLTFIHGIEVWENAKPAYLHGARRATVLLTNSDFTRRKADHLHGGFARARLCWLATESDDLPPPRPEPAGPPQVLIVGRMVADRPKGHRPLIACWPQVTSAVPDALLRVVGCGPDLHDLQRLAAQSSAAGSIIFQGFVSEADLDALYAQTTVFAMPSRGEGFGLVYVEAMRHGLPVIASCHDAAPEIVVDGQTGSIVDEGRPNELAERIIDLLKNREQAKRLGDCGRRRWEEHFRYSAFRDRFRPLLREFMSM